MVAQQSKQNNRSGQHTSQDAQGISRTGRVFLRPLRALAFFALSVSLAALLFVAGCGSGNQGATGQGTSGDAETADGRISIIATIFAPYDFARQVAGERAALRMLVPPGSETHSFEPTPQDIIDIEQCDVFIYVGGESDEWVADLLASLDTSRVTVIRLIDCVPTLEEDDSVLVNPEEAEEEEEEGLPDEHVWTSPLNAKLIAGDIAEALERVDAANASTYQANANEFFQELDALDAQFKEIVAQGNRRELVFGDRFPFRYFADEYGLTCYAAFPGCSTATEASAQTVAALIDVIRRDTIPVVLYRELSNHKMADAIGEETGTQSLLFHSCHNITRDDFDAGATYLSIMRQNAETLKTALA
jgi:zinc transport system substrate-binding protein